MATMTEAVFVDGAVLDEIGRLIGGAAEPTIESLFAGITDAGILRISIGPSFAFEPSSSYGTSDAASRC